jgi:hypothetical protein
MFPQLKPKKGHSGQHLLHQLNPEPSATAAPFHAFGLLIGTIGRLYEDTSKLKTLAAARRYTPLPHDWQPSREPGHPVKAGRTPSTQSYQPAAYYTSNLWSRGCAYGRTLDTTKRSGRWANRTWHTPPYGAACGRCMNGRFGPHRAAHL